MGELMFAIVAADIILRVNPGAMAAVAVVSAVFFLLAFQALSPVMLRNVFTSDLIDDFKKPDMSLVTALNALLHADRHGGVQADRLGDVRGGGHGGAPGIADVHGDGHGGAPPVAGMQVSGSMPIGEEKQPHEAEDKQKMADAGLSSMEIKVAMLLINGDSRREIGRKLHINTTEVSFHENAIREKLYLMGDIDPVIETVAKKYQLTKREGDMLRLVQKGMSNAEIATELFLSEETIRVHIRNLIKKLPVENRRDITPWLESYAG
jgi:DNA-binding CsgD family transcriptional regulator